MITLKVNVSTNPACVRRWAVAAWLFLTLISGATAQNIEPKVAPQGDGQRTQVKQTLWVDESQQLDFESVRAQVFKPFNPIARHSVGDKVVWLRLHIARADAVAGPLWLLLMPAHTGDVTLYSPSQAPGMWNKRELEPEELISKIKLGEATQGDDFFLRIAPRNSSAIVAFVGERDDINLHEGKLAVVMTAISTVVLIVLLVFLWRIFSHFSWMSVLISALLVFCMIHLWLALGYAYTVLGLPLEVGVRSATPNLTATLAIANGIFLLIATEVFSNQRWLRWGWTFPVLQMPLLAQGLLGLGDSFSLSLLLQQAFMPALASALIVAAIREPHSLRTFSSKVALVLLLMCCLLSAIVAFKAGGILGSANIELTTELLVKNLLVRIVQVLVIIILASWIYERIHTQRLQLLHGELQKSSESLELESKRLDRQRKFTAMLAHELKNPLAVSHMALAGIESRLSGNDPLLERSASIKQSLQEIDAIIDRCSEIDGFEQGDLPMNIGSFSLNHLVAMLKESNVNERIYFLLRGVHDDAILTSDMHYLKIIFSNLLTNALKYSPPDTLIELSVQSVMGKGGNKALIFNVSNEVGEAGTPAPSRAFERFYRAEAARNQSGAGLGLWLSQALAHALGSEVVMQNNGDKISFSLTLPYA